MSEEIERLQELLQEVIKCSMWVVDMRGWVSKEEDAINELAEAKAALLAHHTNVEAASTILYNENRDSHNRELKQAARIAELETENSMLLDMIKNTAGADLTADQKLDKIMYEQTNQIAQLEEEVEHERNEKLTISEVDKSTIDFMREIITKLKLEKVGLEQELSERNSYTNGLIDVNHEYATRIVELEQRNKSLEESLKLAGERWVRNDNRIGKLLQNQEELLDEYKIALITLHETENYPLVGELLYKIIHKNDED